MMKRAGIAPLMGLLQREELRTGIAPLMGQIYGSEFILVSREELRTLHHHHARLGYQHHHHARLGYHNHHHHARLGYHHHHHARLGYHHARKSSSQKLTKVKHFA